MEEQDSEEAFAEKTLIQAVQNQIDEKHPAACAAFNKLSLVGYPAEEALRLMALVLDNEISKMLEEGRGFDAQGYEIALGALPQLPGEED